jgi:hypothetical protein
MTSFTIESIDFPKVYLRNSGQNPLSGISVYVNGVQAHFNVSPASIAAGQLGTITIFDFMGVNDVIKVTSSSGFSVSKTVSRDPCEKAVACWKFDEGSGTTAYDSSGNNHASIIGPTWVTGEYGGGLSFDGSDDYVNGGVDGPSLSEIQGSQITLMVHAKPAAVNSGRYLIDKNGPLYFYISDGKLGASLYNGSAVWPSVAGAQTIVADRWYSFMMVYNGSTIRTFVNGQLDGTTSHSGSLAGNGCTQIGRYNNGGCDSGVSSYFSGIIDEARIFNYAVY